jgi:hypothetical protein
VCLFVALGNCLLGFARFLGLLSWCFWWHCLAIWNMMCLH